MPYFCFSKLNWTNEVFRSLQWWVHHHRKTSAWIKLLSNSRWVSRRRKCRFLLKSVNVQATGLESLYVCFCNCRIVIRKVCQFFSLKEAAQSGFYLGFFCCCCANLCQPLRKKTTFSCGICVFVRRCCCLMPLKEINERTTNREGEQRRRDKRRAAREGAAGEEGCSDGGWLCVSVGGVHTRLCFSGSFVWSPFIPAEWNSFSLFPWFFLFFHIFSFSYSSTLSIIWLFPAFCSFFFPPPLFYDLYPSLAPHSCCPGCHGPVTVMSFRTKEPSLPGMWDWLREWDWVRGWVGKS